MNALLVFPVAYLTYKHYNPRLAWFDVPSYMSMATKGGMTAEESSRLFGRPSLATVDPFRHRILVPILIKAMDALPGYNLNIAFTNDDAVNKTFFHFVVLNTSLVLLASVILFQYLLRFVAPGFAYLGSILYLFSYFTVTTDMIPMVDAACQLAIIFAVFFLDRNRPVAFSLACLAGVFAKETVLVVMLPWIVVQAVRDRKRLWYLLLTVPALLAYFATMRFLPAATQFPYYDHFYVLENALRVFDLRIWGRGFISETFLGHLPLLVAFLGFAWLRFFCKVHVKLNGEFVVFIFLMWLGITSGADGACGGDLRCHFGLGGGRDAFMVFPAIMLFETRVFEAIWLRQMTHLSGSPRIEESTSEVNASNG